MVVAVIVIMIIVVGVLMYGHEANLARPDLLDYAARTTRRSNDRRRQHGSASPKRWSRRVSACCRRNPGALPLPRLACLSIMRPSFADVDAPRPCPVSH
jgi:hypothetical protein